MSNHVVVKRLESREEAQRGFCCMSEVPTPWPAALDLCRAWVSQNLGQHVLGYHVQDAADNVIGQLYFAPSEQALVPYEIEPGVAVMYCEWIQRRYQKQDLGHELFAIFTAEMQAQGCKGILVEATNSEERMHYRHYLARGFHIVHEGLDRKVLYLPLAQPNVTVRPFPVRIQPRKSTPVEILILSGYLCPFETSTRVQLLEIAREFGDRVVVREEPLTPDTLRRYGVAAGIFINGRPKLTGALTEDEIRQAIAEEL